MIVWKDVQKTRCHFLVKSIEKNSPPTASKKRGPRVLIISLSNRLDGSVVGDGRKSLGLALLVGDGAGLAGHGGLALEEGVGAVGLCLALLLGVGLDTGQELVTRTRVADVLDADVDALLDVTVADLAVEDDTDGGLGHVVDDTGLSVVDLVGHTVVGVRGVGSCDSECCSKLATDPFWTAPLATTSTISPTLYCLR
jgi:hypothetical protein